MGKLLVKRSSGWCSPQLGKAEDRWNVAGCAEQGQCGSAVTTSPWQAPGRSCVASPGTAGQAGEGRQLGHVWSSHLWGWRPTWRAAAPPCPRTCTPKRVTGPKSAPLSPLSLQLHWTQGLGTSKTEMAKKYKTRISASNYLYLLLLLYCLRWTRFTDPEFKLGLEAKLLLEPWDPEQGKEETSMPGEGEVILIRIHLESQLLPCRYKGKLTQLALSNVHFQDAQLLTINPVAGWSIGTDVPKAALFSEMKRMKLCIRQIKKKFKYLHPLETRCWKNRHDKIAAIKCNLIYNSESMLLPKADFEFSLWTVLLWCMDFPDFLWHFNQQPNDVIIFLKQKNKWRLFRHN